MTKEDATKPGCNKTKVFVWFLRIIKVISILALLLAAVSYCLQMKSAVTSDMNDFDKAFSFLSTMGYVVLCLIMVIAELELEAITKRVPVLKFWIVRGFALCWLGVQTIHSAEQLASAISTTVSEGEADTFTTVSQVCGWTLIGVAILYVFMTLTCMHKIFGLDSLNDVNATLIVVRSGVSREDDYTNMSTSKSSSSSKEDAEIISNLCIALNITSREARSRFGGSGGAEEARKMRRDQQSKASAATFDDADNYNSKPNKTGSDAYDPPQVVSTGGSAYTPAAGDDDDEDPKARRRREQDELDAQYYASQQ